ncbi:type 1 glutamine amidotransferase domain-containing protein [Rugamonas sp.]|uniref:type 1 glutamine amidotransferase domain-containing protein n=1 Tax=Rugamonas sp. TaxID=1926287 RepID=UPI0025DCD1BC|nr:type 1 glutamine amidotransferase domain-containing protein [Rugamonas sp.]
MKILFIVTSADLGYWLPELTRPYWHLTERGHTVTLASPAGGPVKHGRLSNPHSEGSWEAGCIVSKGFLSDAALADALNHTAALTHVRGEDFDAVHVVGGTGAAVDLYPNADVERLLEHFHRANKVLGAICHGTIALGNLRTQLVGRKVTGFSLIEDLEAEKLYGKDFIPHYPQPVLEQAGMLFSHVEPWGLRVVVDGKLV